jgi:hypothetical protein
MQVVRINHTLKYTESQILVVKYFICGSSHHDDDDHTTLTSSGCCSWPFTHYRYEWRTYNLIYWGCGAKIHSQKLGSSGCPAPKSATPRRHLAWRSTWGVFAVKMCWLCFFWTITTGWPKCNHLPIYSELQRMEVTSKSVVNLIVIVLYILWCTHSMCALYVYYIYIIIYMYIRYAHISNHTHTNVLSTLKELSYTISAGAWTRKSWLNPEEAWNMYLCVSHAKVPVCIGVPLALWLVV